ncbi:hypothetical protein C8J23_1033 [Shewanella chilikensis]|uniref:Uncharacterized protein n=1 Tax=Shewanella chilikensis TaxID=558541 RepID=A0ABX5PS02_9GAMM|nr:hypothetical protein C8J23_1033 [Shewanella chilikensis]
MYTNITVHKMPNKRLQSDKQTCHSFCHKSGKTSASFVCR